MNFDHASQSRPHPADVENPPRYRVIGVPISATDYAGTVDRVLAAARSRTPFLVTALAVHGTVEATRDEGMKRAIEDFDIVAPDGQPVRIALNLLHAAELRDRVYGPSLMLKICEKAAQEDTSIYLYGSTEATVRRLEQALRSRFPTLRIAGAEPSIFRELTADESRALGERIRRSGAMILFVGLGCPRQEKFAAAHRNLLGLPQICIGAAFDFHAGTKAQAPQWMQDHALEWLFRLWQEPRRLLGRYFVTNNLFLWRLARQYASVKSPAIRSRRP
jgi:N-acetylglucosaminyldiphosphoundecaprenol N-acetyl-beta-D-mannosaminyltransferase